MIRLKPLEDEPDQVLKKILENKTASIKSKGRTIKVRDEVNYNIIKILDRYDEYNASKTKLQYVNKSSISDELKYSMLHCYNGKTIPLSNLKKNILENQPQNLGKTCQMCGINSADSFDHYIPKDDMAEFSVYPQNLIPICSECNRKKGDFWFFDRKFINLYYDLIPNTQIIKCEIKVDEVPIPNYFFKKGWEIEIDDEIDEYNIRLIKNHYISLDLFNRYSIACISKLSELIDDYSLFDKDIKEYIKYLKVKHENYSKQYGINNFITILINGLLSSDTFFEYLKKNF